MPILTPCAEAGAASNSADVATAAKSADFICCLPAVFCFEIARMVVKNPAYAHPFRPRPLVWRTRAKQAVSSRRRPGPIARGGGCRARLVTTSLLRPRSWLWFPGLRRDDTESVDASLAT